MRPSVHGAQPPVTSDPSSEGPGWKRTAAADGAVRSQACSVSSQRLGASNAGFRDKLIPSAKLSPRRSHGPHACSSRRLAVPHGACLIPRGRVRGSAPRCTACGGSSRLLLLFAEIHGGGSKTKQAAPAPDAAPGGGTPAAAGRRWRRRRVEEDTG
ncbi:unnamed protein product [Pleuronectes platessa]|uniref:Uncharacterized protein n=1 Tax=Pleuronectes platessa TaxID=8262 RepID=A0A9N7US77_PLEPL|nr:unnamed protein product [Pleuronectes platessa]